MSRYSQGWKRPTKLLTEILDPVLLCNNLGATQNAQMANMREDTSVSTSNGHNALSIKEAVRVAQGNNFMGLICSSRLLVCMNWQTLNSKADSFARLWYHH